MKALLGLALFITMVGTGFALKCYVCNSHLDEACKELDITSSKADDFLKDCANEPDGEKFTLCRKIEMHMDMDYGKFHDAEQRVHRACGWEEHTSYGECYYKSGYNTRSWVCACKDDKCNDASIPSIGFAVLLPIILAAVLRMDVHY